MKHRGCRYIACMFLVFSLFFKPVVVMAEATPTDATPTDALVTEEWNDDTKEETWMTYCLTDWPGLNVALTSGGDIGFTELADEFGAGFDEYMTMYGSIVDEVIDELKGQAYVMGEKLTEDVESYRNLLLFTLLMQNRIVLHAIGYYPYIADGDNIFHMDTSYIEAGSMKIDEDGEYVLGIEGNHHHNKNDIAFVSIFVDKDYYLPKNISDHNQKKLSVKKLLKELIRANKDPYQQYSDPFKSEDPLMSTWLIRISCPEYAGVYDYNSFREHICTIIKNNKKAVIKGTKYPWIRELGYVDDTGDFHASNFDENIKYGLNIEGEWTVKEHSTEETFNNNYECFPSYLSLAQSQYIGITVKIDNKRPWGDEKYVEDNGG